MDVVNEVSVAVAHASNVSNFPLSTRAVSRDLSLPRSKRRKILRYILHWYPNYKINKVHQLHLPQGHDFAPQF